MDRSVIVPHQSDCRLGLARCDITPPVGIYHRFWGAASHDQATGVHRPLTATAVAFAPRGAASREAAFVWVALDHCLFRPPEMAEVRRATAAATSPAIDAERISFLFSHTHAAGHIARTRADMPGGDLIGPYLEQLAQNIGQAIDQAMARMTDVSINYATTRCDMGRNRDCWDEAAQQFVVGFNPDAPAGLAVQVARMTSEGRVIGSFVHYPCHPTTLAWDNTLISPDYVGAMREVVEGATGAPCVFFLAPSGDIGPRDGFVGDVDVADKNGRQLGYAALSALESMDPPNTAFTYAGPVVSGATLGTWAHEPLSSEAQQAAARFRHDVLTVDVDYAPSLPSLSDAEQQLDDALERESNAKTSGDGASARDARAMVERKRRQLEMLRPMPPGARYPFELNVWQLGDAVWIAMEGEPYYAIQQRLTEWLPDRRVFVLPLANGARCSYLPRRDDYDKPLYQAKLAPLAAGTLERLTHALAEHVRCGARRTAHVVQQPDHDR